MLIGLADLLLCLLSGAIVAAAPSKELGPAVQREFKGRDLDGLLHLVGGDFLGEHGRHSPIKTGDFDGRRDRGRFLGRFLGAFPVGIEVGADVAMAGRDAPDRSRLLDPPLEPIRRVYENAKPLAGRLPF